MLIFPAIDIISGRCVRLTQGDYGKEKKYDITPMQAAKNYKADGADYLHVVDLDAALKGSSENFDVICDLAKNSGLYVQTGGGIRNPDIIERYINNGVKRVILGTGAIKDKAFLENSLATFPGYVAVSLDIKDDYIYTNGWTVKSNLTIYDFLDSFDTSLLSAAVITDISKDGMMEGSNTSLMEKLNKLYDINFIASGGVCTMDDIKTLKEMDMYAAIIGKALYEKTLDLKEVLNFVNN
ncbi:MAG: 1-(5-phosphoribosyl)-5-[(5-phosphoribosylamino)methylideneamino]imidazole-4-carboxamide isomerase [Eubacteriaceae bacterium]